MNTALHRNRRGFTLVEIMIVVAIIGILASIGIPNYVRSRKRAQATRILNDLRLIDESIDIYAVEYQKSGSAVLSWAAVQTNLKPASQLYSSGGVDLLGNSFGTFAVDSSPLVPAATFTTLSDVAPADFWSPYK